jgi:hypothetical protein
MRYLRPCLALCIALCLGAAPAGADTGIGPGLFVSSDGTTSAGVMGSLNLFALPVVPVKVQLSGGSSLSGGAGPGEGPVWMGTVEAEYEAKRVFVGAGGGFGVLRAGDSGGAIYDFFVGGRLAPLVSVIAKYYGGSTAVGCPAMIFRLPGPCTGSTSTAAGYVGITIGLK